MVTRPASASDAFNAGIELNCVANYGRTLAGVWVPVNTDASGNMLFNAASATPGGATQIVNGSGNVGNASAIATLAAAAGKFTFITGFQITALGATAAANVRATLAGIIGGTIGFNFAFPLGAAVPAVPFIVTFPIPLASALVNTAIVLTLPAGGAGNTNAEVSAQGFQL